ncbi:anacyclamide/piricyclamide family prenylated cyclic peptide [Streptosporangium carneum]|uniref:Uncharacterized protein n=1 Tax=Streptosporangium carneum TaxID=47481 RepID=A0A9W6I4Q0_9ACTN|nr:anacyclamide/piricyclamide family prenylated cyclic peptide [Streptosporangium carneum]GLK12001.1 hypothetical protein GCM10017600_54090 [Streptosporangium carneum]
MSTMPHQSAPVERTLTGTATSDTDGIASSIWGDVNYKGIPFAGDDDN